MAKQIPFSFPCREALSQEDFMVSPSNKAAVGMIDRWPDWPSNWLILTGPAGAGKTHLSNVWRLRSGAKAFDARAITTELLDEEDLSKGVVVEDIDRPLLPGQTLDETALFHLLNLAKEQTFQVLLTGQYMPGRWVINLADLRSRLRAAPVITIEEPDDTLLNMLLIKQFSDRQLQVGPQVVDYLINRMERNADFVRTLVTRLDEASLAQRRQVTRPLASLVLQELLDEQNISYG